MIDFNTGHDNLKAKAQMEIVFFGPPIQNRNLGHPNHLLSNISHCQRMYSFFFLIPVPFISTFLKIFYVAYIKKRLSMDGQNRKYNGS